MLTNTGCTSLHVVSANGQGLNALHGFGEDNLCTCRRHFCLRDWRQQDQPRKTALVSSSPRTRSRVFPRKQPHPFHLLTNHPWPLVFSQLKDQVQGRGRIDGVNHLPQRPVQRGGVHAKYRTDVNGTTATQAPQGQSCMAQRRQPATRKTRAQNVNQVDHGVRRHAHDAGNSTAVAGLYVLKSRKGVYNRGWKSYNSTPARHGRRRDSDVRRSGSIPSGRVHRGASCCEQGGHHEGVRQY